MLGYRAEIRTPDGRLYEGRVESVVLPGSDGRFGVLAGHAPMAAPLRAGVAVLRSGSETLFFAVGEGMARVGGDGLTVFVEAAVRARDAVDAEDRLEELLKASQGLPTLEPRKRE